MAMKTLILITVLAFFTAPLTVYAYIDPGSGSFIIQAILAFLLGAGYMVKVYWRKIKNVFARRSAKQDKNENENE